MNLRGTVKQFTTFGPNGESFYISADSGIPDNYIWEDGFAQNIIFYLHNDGVYRRCALADNTSAWYATREEAEAVLSKPTTIEQEEGDYDGDSRRPH